MRNYTITSTEIRMLEDMNTKLDSITALTKVCGSAFLANDAFGNMNPLDVHETFNNIMSQIEDVSKDVGVLIAAIYGTRSEKVGDQND